MTALETLYTLEEQHSNRQSQLADRCKLWTVLVCHTCLHLESLQWTLNHCEADLHYDWISDSCGIHVCM